MFTSWCPLCPPPPPDMSLSTSVPLAPSFAYHFLGPSLSSLYCCLASANGYVRCFCRWHDVYVYIVQGVSVFACQASGCGGGGWTNNKYFCLPLANFSLFCVTRLVSDDSDYSLRMVLYINLAVHGVRCHFCYTVHKKDTRYVFYRCRTVFAYLPIVDA